MSNHKMCLTPHCNHEGPCPMPPHPALLDHLTAERLRLQQIASSDQSVLSGPTGTLPGLNDGTIFPKSHYERVPVPSASRMSREALERAPLRGRIRVAIVLVDFSDTPMTIGTAQHFNELFFSEGSIPTGSVTEYYTDVSGGLIELAGEVVGPLRMPLKLTQYAHGASGLTDQQPNLQTLGGHALAAADSHINLKDYDNDDNGQVDAFIVVHAGEGAEQTIDETERENNIWSAKWNLIDSTPVDGTHVFGFLTIPEFAKIGVCAHELGHLLFGWPDLYDIDKPVDKRDDERIGIPSAGIGNWCLMAGGSWGALPGNAPGTTPCHPSAWCKANQGWATVIADSENGSITLKDVKKNPHEVHRLWKNGDTASQEYFLVENRQKVGYDRSMPGEGLLVWHVDDAKLNNRDEEHYKVGLMQSDGRRQLEKSNRRRGDAGDPFPGTANNTSFGAFTNPNSRTYGGMDSKVSITNISPSSQTMTMNITVSNRPATTGTPKL